MVHYAFQKIIFVILTIQIALNGLDVFHHFQDMNVIVLWEKQENTAKKVYKIGIQQKSMYDTQRFTF